MKEAADPDAAYYVRTNDKSGAARNKGRVRKGWWAYEAKLVVSGSDDPTRDHAFPNLVVGMAPLHRPATGVGENATRALGSVAARGYATRWLAGDRAYTNALPETFSLPARALGYRPGPRLQSRPAEGPGLAQRIDFCRRRLVLPRDATSSDQCDRGPPDRHHRRRPGVIASKRYPYRLRPKGRPDREGHVRLLCPASDGAYTARCELKPASIKRTNARTVHIPLTDALQLRPPVVCTQQSTTFPPEAGAKLLQELHYGSAEWSATYGTLCNGVEGFNGQGKDGAGSALADPSRRRIRGTAAQSLLAALVIAATNLANIHSFQRNARPDADGTLRRRRKRRRSTRPIQNWAPHVPTLSGAPPP